MAVINRYQDDLGGVHAVQIDNTSGTYAATQLLIQQGHRAIGFIHAPITGTLANRASIERVEGFRRAMREAGLSVNEEWLREGASSIYSDGQQTMRVAKAILESKPRPTALLCANDYTAMAALRTATELGLRVPQDLAIVGHDNIAAGAFCTPALTTVQQPMFEAGVEAAKAVLAALKSTSDPIQVTLPCKLIVRESCGAGQRSV